MAETRLGNGLFGRGIDRICAVVAARTARGMAAQVLAARRFTRTIEIRLDWLRNGQQRKSFLVWLRRRHPPARLIATCRTVLGGGRFRASTKKELAWLSAAVTAGCAWCDLEIESLRKLSSAAVRQAFASAKILLSFHDFRRTPARLGRFWNEGRRWQAACVKVAAQANTIGDSLRILRLARNRREIVVVPMGEIGLPARILALREGSGLAYAPVDTATAPGQISLHELKHLYRAHELTRRTRVYGVIGDPIGHSLSPLLHNTGFVARKVDAVYLPFLVKGLPDFLKAVPELGICGFSVTIPHKETIMRYLDDCDPLAAEIGAVNTVVVRGGGKLYGSNTDYVGVLRALEGRLRLAGSRILIFGAGGAARAAAFGLARAGAAVAVCARRESRARELARAVGGEAVPRRALRAQYFDAILNTTPVGMYPHAAISPLLSRELHCRVAMDMIYRPQKTQLLRLAKRKGCEIISGVEIFLAQGFAQWEIWTGQRAPEAAMRRAVLRKLEEEERRGTALERSRRRR